MPLSVTQQQILSLVPHGALKTYLDAFASADTVLSAWGINTELRVAHFIAQVMHECGGLTILAENMNYSAERLTQVWPSRFPTVAIAQRYAHSPRVLANKVYGNRMGNYAQDDGWTYRGRGLLQITGRASYEQIGKLLGIDLPGTPDFAISSEHALDVAAAEWKTLGCNEAADTDNIALVTRKVNGGTIGLAERTQWLHRTKAIWAPLPPGTLTA